MFDQWFRDLNLDWLTPQLVSEYAVRVLLVVLALALIWLFRRVLAFIIVRPLRLLTRRTANNGDDSLVDAARVPVQLMIISLAIYVSAILLRISTGGFVDNLCRSLVIMAIFLFCFNAVDVLVPSSRRLFAVTGINLEERLLPFIRTAIKLVLIAIGIVVFLQEWNFDISGLIAGIGLGGLAFSLAAQDTVANLFGFTAIVGDRPFNIGDYIKTPDVEGIVEHVGLRSTRVRQLDQAVVSVPNNKLANSAVLNWSRLSKRRVDYVIGLTYDTSSANLRVLLDRIRVRLREWETVDADRVQVYFLGFGESSLNIMVRCYVWIADWGQFMAEQELINLEIMDIVEDMKLSFAFPSRSIYIENVPEMKLDAPLAQLNTLSPRERAILQSAKTFAPHGDEPQDSDPKD